MNTTELLKEIEEMETKPILKTVIEDLDLSNNLFALSQEQAKQVLNSYVLKTNTLYFLITQSLYKALEELINEEEEEHITIYIKIVGDCTFYLLGFEQESIKYLNYNNALNVLLNYVPVYNEIKALDIWTEEERETLEEIKEDLYNIENDCDYIETMIENASALEDKINELVQDIENRIEGYEDYENFETISDNIDALKETANRLYDYRSYLDDAQSERNRLSDDFDYIEE